MAAFARSSPQAPRPRQAQLARFTDEISIRHRPHEVAEREIFGAWECDLIQFRQEFGGTNLTSLVERVSRFTVLMKNADRRSRPVMDGLIASLSPLPAFARQSITFDRGLEFLAWPYLQAGLGIATWFCDPQSPWQKGTVENTNGRVRRWLPREIDPKMLTTRGTNAICQQLNSTPRKCLGYRTPAEVFREKLMEGTSTLP
jgi:IS30 family transposase